MKKYCSVILFWISAFLVIGCTGGKVIKKRANNFMPAEQLIPEYRIGPGDQITLSYFKNYGAYEQDYTLTTGDTISVNIEGHPEWAVTSLVKPDGKISLYRIGQLKAAGLTHPKLQRLLTKKYSKIIDNPQIDLFFNEFQTELEDFLSTLSKSSEGINYSMLVRLDGKISLPLINQIEVSGRTIPEITESVRKRYKKIFKDIDITLNLKSSNSKYVAVLGEVKNPGIFSITTSLTSTQAIAMSGGFLDSANSENVVLIKNGREKVVNLDFDKMFHQGTPYPNTVLAPNDVLFVPKKGIAKTNVWVDQHIRKLLPMTMSAGIFYPLR